MPFFPPGPYAPGPFRFSGVERESDERPWHWTRTVMLIGFFGCILSFYTVASWTMVSRTFLSQALLFFSCIGLLLFPWSFYQRFLRVTPFEAFLFNVMGAGPLIFSALLWANFLFHAPVEEEVHRIEERETLRNILNPAMEYHLEGEAFEERPEFRRFSFPHDEEGIERIQKADRVEYRTAVGALGYRVVLERRPML